MYQKSGKTSPSRMSWARAFDHDNGLSGGPVEKASLKARQGHGRTGNGKDMDYSPRRAQRQIIFLPRVMRICRQVCLPLTSSLCRVCSAVGEQGRVHRRTSSAFPGHLPRSVFSCGCLRLGMSCVSEGVYANRSVLLSLPQLSHTTMVLRSR